MLFLAVSADRVSALLSRRHCLLRIILCGLIAILFGLAAPVRAEEVARAEKAASAEQAACGSCAVSNCPANTSTPPREQDSLWIVSTRHLGCVGCGAVEAPPLQVWQYNQTEKKWDAADIAKLLAASKAAAHTSLFAHGNRNNSQDAISEGWAFYHAVAKDAPKQPICFIIWSWPSDEIRGQIRDVRAKLERSNIECAYLASLLVQFPEETSLSLIGYSYGARIVVEALHIAGGGQFAGRSLKQSRKECCLHARVVLLAAAIDCGALADGNICHKATTQLDGLLNLFNSCDPTLRFYPRIEPRRCRCGLGPEALGYVGAAGNIAGLEQLNVVNLIGGTHDWRAYLCHPQISARIGKFLWK